LKVSDPWQFEAAAMLSQIGCVPMPVEVQKKHFGEEIPALSETGGSPSHARVAARILERIPRLDMVAQMIGRQHEAYEPVAHHGPQQYRIAFGAQLLRVALDFDRGVGQGRSFAEALEELRRNASEYSPQILSALGNVIRQHAGPPNTDLGEEAFAPLGEPRPPWPAGQSVA
jgi:response regulator RpfG family c-di-GMP phosphodiesterase